MTDEPDEQLDPASPEDEARIRRLLSDARATGPTPTEVVARLDDALVGLSAERVVVDPVPADNVIPITRTRRHRVVTVLGVAAAIGVFGLGVGAVVNSDQSDDDQGAGADSAVAERGDGSLDEGAADAPPNEAATPTKETADPKGDDHELDDRAYVVRSRHLSRDLARIQGLALPEPDAAAYDRGLIHTPEGFTCELATSGRGILVGVRYEGDPAYVRFLEPVGDSQVVEVLQCGTGDLVRSTTLPTPG